MHMVYLSKTVCWSFHFGSRLDFIKLFIFVQKPWTLDVKSSSAAVRALATFISTLTLKRHNSFQSKNNRKTT